MDVNAMEVRMTFAVTRTALAVVFAIAFRGETQNVDQCYELADEFMNRLLADCAKAAVEQEQAA